MDYDPAYFDNKRGGVEPGPNPFAPLPHQYSKFFPLW